MPSAVYNHLTLFLLVFVKQMASTMLRKQTLSVAIFSAVSHLFLIFHYSSVELYQILTGLPAFLLFAGFARYKVLIFYY